MEWRYFEAGFLIGMATGLSLMGFILTKKYLGRWLP